MQCSIMYCISSVLRQRMDTAVTEHVGKDLRYLTTSADFMNKTLIDEAAVADEGLLTLYRDDISKIFP